MRRLTALLLATGLAITWSAGARAADDGYSLLRCGVQLGGSELAYRPASTATRRAGLANLGASGPRAGMPGLPGAAGPVFIEPPRIDFQFRDAANRRLPAVLAIARIGCSWR